MTASHTEPETGESSPTPWRTVGRPGYVGKRAREVRVELDARHGAGRWRIAYAWDGRIISREEALELYAEAYRVHLERHRDALNWLIATARDVYDLEPRDVESKLDFSIQLGKATHLQDIAVRRAVAALGRCFEGSDLIQIRGRRSPGFHLNPGQVSFHMPERILTPELSGWWKRGSIESFWQSNKILQVWPRRILMFGGSFNPIHAGHLALARHARDTLGFDLVLFIPNGDNYRKPDLAAGADRLAMVAAAIEGEVGFEVLDVEVKSPEPMRTLRTARELRARFPEDDLFLLRGLDALPRTHRELFEIPGLVVLVVDRGGATSFDDVLVRHRRLEQNRARIDYRPGGFSFDLSASDVRRAVTAGDSIDALVPPRVAELIRVRGLYR